MLTVADPITFVSRSLKYLNVNIFYNVVDAIKNTDVIIRPAYKKKGKDIIKFPDVKKYFKFFSVNEKI